jgi:hypothetical protein
MHRFVTDDLVRFDDSHKYFDTLSFQLVHVLHGFRKDRVVNMDSHDTNQHIRILGAVFAEFFGPEISPVFSNTSGDRDQTEVDAYWAMMSLLRESDASTREPDKGRYTGIILEADPNCGITDFVVQIVAALLIVSPHENRICTVITDNIPLFQTRVSAYIQEWFCAQKSSTVDVEMDDGRCFVTLENGVRHWVDVNQYLVCVQNAPFVIVDNGHAPCFCDEFYIRLFKGDLKTSPVLVIMTKCDKKLYNLKFPDGEVIKTVTSYSERITYNKPVESC